MEIKLKSGRLINTNCIDCFKLSKYYPYPYCYEPFCQNDNPIIGYTSTNTTYIKIH